MPAKKANMTHSPSTPMKAQETTDLCETQKIPDPEHHPSKAQGSEEYRPTNVFGNPSCTVVAPYRIDISENRQSLSGVTGMGYQ
eukprot:gene7160-14576_t